ncbi:MAG: hypothetical protein PWQ75_72 [Methanolobus sp.]|uniref:Eco57I restriction-modification methylase domain-containing protein n=1 Tax=Methanolobus sp. TaxID=1874737 RepID=UPI00258A5DCD|nr:TaqI-like C-terminal specificity domain-containing protein [Methanolobus sp.]MDK2830320.1 hypothetical protein [Methanolobus sp.]
MKSEIIKVINKELAKYPVEKKKISGKDYDLFIFDKDEHVNVFEGFLFTEVEDKSDFLFFLNKYKPPVNGHNPRFVFALYKEKLLVKDYRQQNTHVLKTISKVNKTFLKKITKVISDPSNENIRKLFDRSDMIEEFYILYNKSRDFLLKNIKGISDEERREAFIDNLMLQILTLWYLQERDFFNNDNLYFITKFKELEQKKLSDDFKSYYNFINYLFDKVSDNIDKQFIDDEKIGKVVVVGPAIFLNGNYSTDTITIPNKCFYKEEVTDILISTPAKKVNVNVPILNLLDSRDWTDMDEYVLGSLYEKLITQDVRKKTGSYYTPPNVTSYICENSIKPYLVDRINISSKKSFNSLNEIISDGNKEHLMLLFQEMKDIKILDPAVGSAHFMESSIDVLLNIYETIWEKAKEIKLRKGMEITVSDEVGRIKNINLLDISNEEQFKLYIKFFIILSNNIYGVDKNKTALKVARARLFLILARHFDAKKNYFIRFPNVHFNLREGNSLVGYIELNDRPKGQATFDFYINETDGYYVSEPIKVVSELKPYLSDISKVLKLNGDIVKEVEELNKILSKSSIAWFEFEKVLRIKDKLVQVLIVSLDNKYAKPLHDLLTRINILFNKKLDERFAEEYSIDINILKETKTFHWMFEFPEVFLQKKGFDVIVGNPPYGDILEEEEKQLVKEILNYKTTLTDENGKGSTNASSLFIERSASLLSDKGIFANIVPNAIIRTDEFVKTRNLLLTYYLYHIVDESNPFDGVTLEMVSIFYKKDIVEADYCISVISKRTSLNVKENSVRKSTFIKYNRFILYWDEMWDYIHDNSFHRIDGTRGPTIESKYLSQNRDDAHMIPVLVSGKTATRYGLVEQYFKWGNKQIFKSPTVENIHKKEMLVSTRLSNNYRVALKPKGYVAADNLLRIEFDKSQINMFVLMLVLNSKLMNYITVKYISNHIELTMFLNAVTPLTPIVIPNEQKTFENLCKSMIILISNDEKSEQVQNITDYLDETIINYLVYELYFISKFNKDHLYSEPTSYLLNFVSKHLKPIEYNRWAELYWKKQLEEDITAVEEKELSKLEEENLQVINEIYDTLSNDEEIKAQIETIKKHEWVKTIESH